MQPEQVNVPRINVPRLMWLLLVCLILPVLMAVLLDILLETAPLFTLFTGVACLTLAGIVVVRAATLEFDQVASKLAPEQTEQTLDAKTAASEVEPAQAAATSPTQPTELSAPSVEIKQTKS